MPLHPHATALMFGGQGSVTEADRDLVQTRRPDLLELAEELLGDDPFAMLEEGTRYAQPATFCASLAGASSVLGDDSVAFMSGHSMGEITALAAAEALDDADGLRVVVERGRLMDARGDEEGAMVAVRCDRARGAEIAERFGLNVANENSPEQVVLSGAASGVEKLLASTSELGVRGKRLPVAGAFHSEIMAPVVPEFQEVLDSIDFQRPSVPVLSCVTVQPFGPAVREDLASALTRPVRWVSVLRELETRGAKRFVDVGPGRVLAGLARKTLTDVEIETAEREAVGA